MTDDELLAAVLRRFLASDEYVGVGETWLTLDGRIDISTEESAAVERAATGYWTTGERHSEHRR